MARTKYMSNPSRSWSWRSPAKASGWRLFPIRAKISSAIMKCRRVYGAGHAGRGTDSRTTAICHTRGRTQVPEATAGGGVPPVFKIWIRRGRRRTHHGARPGEARPFLGESLRHVFRPDSRVRFYSADPPGEGGA